MELDRLLLGGQDCALHADAPRRWTAKRRARVRQGQRLKRAAAAATATTRRARALYIARRVHRVARGPRRVGVPPRRRAPGRAERDARERAAANSLGEHEHGVHRAARPRLARGQAVVRLARGRVVKLARRARRRAHAAHAPGARVQGPQVLRKICRARRDRVRLGRVAGDRVDRKAPRLERKARRRRALEADARALHQHERRALLRERLAREVRVHRAVHCGLVAPVLPARLALADHKHRIQIVLRGRAGDVGRPREHAELVAVARGARAALRGGADALAAADEEVAGGKVVARGAGVELADIVPVRRALPLPEPHVAPAARGQEHEVDKLVLKLGPQKRLVGVEHEPAEARRVRARDLLGEAVGARGARGGKLRDARGAELRAPVEPLKLAAARGLVDDADVGDRRQRALGRGHVGVGKRRERGGHAQVRLDEAAAVARPLDGALVRARGEPVDRRLVRRLRRAPERDDDAVEHVRVARVGARVVVGVGPRAAQVVLGGQLRGRRAVLRVGGVGRGKDFQRTRLCAIVQVGACLACSRLRNLGCREFAVIEAETLAQTDPGGGPATGRRHAV